MQTSFGINMLSLGERGRQPRLMTLKRMLQEYIEHRREIIRRRTEFDLDKARARAHILDGLKRAIDILDEVIQTIRDSRTRDSARNNLIRDYSFSEAHSRHATRPLGRSRAQAHRRRVGRDSQDHCRTRGDFGQSSQTQ
jgi:DNA gyrase subunit A